MKKFITTAIAILLAFAFIVPYATIAVSAAEEKVMAGTNGTMRDSINSSDDYHVYSEPSSGSKVLKVYDKGQKVTIEKKTTNLAGNVWYYITSPIKGWVWSGNIDVSSNWTPNGAVEPGKVSGAYGASGVKMEYSAKSYHSKTIDWAYTTKGRIELYRTVLTPTRIRYRTFVKALSDWVTPRNVSAWKTTETKTTTHTIGGEVSIGLKALGVKGKYEVTLKGESSQSLEFDVKSFNPDHRYRYCYWQDYLEYNAVTHKFNTLSKKYDIKVTTVGGQTVTGKYREIFSEPTKAFMWGR